MHLLAPINDYFGKVGKWGIAPENPTVTWFADSSAQPYLSQIQNAFNDWGGIPTVYIQFAQASSASSANILVKGVDTLQNGSASSEAGPTGIDGLGHFTGCEVHLLNSTMKNSGAGDAQATVTHEVGHCLGLMHSVSATAVMSYNHSSTSTTEDDWFALTVLYPKDGSDHLPMGCATVQRPGAPRGGSGPLLAADALLLLAMFLGYRILRGGRHTAC